MLFQGYQFPNPLVSFSWTHHCDLTCRPSRMWLDKCDLEGHPFLPQILRNIAINCQNLGISIGTSLLCAHWNWRPSSSDLDNCWCRDWWIGTSNLHKHVKMMLGKVSRKEFGWLVVCSVFVDALSLKTKHFSYDLLC